VVTYWDASALVPLLINESTSRRYRSQASNTEIFTWWGTYLECSSAIARQAHHGTAPEEAAAAYRRLDQLAARWREIGPSEQLRRAAARMLKRHLLRTGDALQLGAALVAGGFEPETVHFLTEDLRLKAAAEREGFVVE
jgi:predicted nucleic acid-binding protein